MDDVTNTSGKARAAKPASVTEAFFAMPKFDMPKFEIPKMEVPAAYREFAEKTVAQATEACEQMKTAAETATGTLEETYSAAAKGFAAYNLEVIKTAHTNVKAAMDFAQKLLAVKSPSEVFELSTAQASKQFGVVSEQSKELATLGQKVLTEAAEPFKAGLAKAFKKAA